MMLYKPQIDRHADLKKELLTRGDPYTATIQVPLESKRFRVLLSPRKNKSWIKDIVAVFKRLGEKKFISLASITLEEVRKAGLADLIETEQIGSREVVSVVPLESYAT